MKSLKTTKPESGFRYLMGFLQQHGFHVQQRHVWQSLHWVDGLNHHLWKTHVIRRWKYNIPRSNALWHIDGHHKLICWGFIIHALIDGYCRTISSLIHLSSAGILCTVYSLCPKGHWNQSKHKQSCINGHESVHECKREIWPAISCQRWPWWQKYPCCNIHGNDVRNTLWVVFMGLVSLQQEWMYKGLIITSIDLLATLELNNYGLRLE